MVIMKSVAMKPRRASTISFPGQKESNLSSIAIEPCPCGLSEATRLYIGTIAKRVSATMSRVAKGESSYRERRDAGDVA